ncbi:hypothetical protein [Roseibium aestuarii]|uniref:Uncharacterized protein n=1 Tax=Roseibium aestuarii TaxID=2600299 RepID=A0ABW4JS41_9HYPH|nr:hypothetical protein [Roseibium aestuarii]
MMPFFPLAAGLLALGLFTDKALASCGTDTFVAYQGPGASGEAALQVSPADDQIQSLYGPSGDRPDGAQVIVITEGNEPFWLKPGDTLEEVATGLGLNAVALPSDPDCRPAPPPGGAGGLTFTEEEGLTVDKDDLTFREDEGLEVGPGGQPRDGLWRAEIGPSRMEGCPAMMQGLFPMAAGQAPGGMAGMAGERRLSFSRPFNPDALELSRTARVKWTRTGGSIWETKDMAAAQFAAIPAGEGGGSHLLWTLQVLSPQEITFRRSMEIVLPAEAAIVMGGSPGACRIVGTDRWIRVGD